MAYPATTLPSYGERLEQGLRQLGIEKLKPKQVECIEARWADKDVLGVLPTNYGKSLCFQLPGVMKRERSAIISPLIALQEDQVRKLRKRGVKAFAYHSGLDDVKKAAVHYYFNTAPADEPSFLYISPELLLTEAFHSKFGNVCFGHLAVDEAHCVSTWGDSFRPEYQRIRVAAKMLNIPSTSAYGATVDPKIERDIAARIPLREGFVRVEEDPMRPNLQLAVEKYDPWNPKSLQKTYRLMRVLKHPDFQGPAIVYYNSLRGVAALYASFVEAFGFLQQTGFTPLLFHSQLSQAEKDKMLKDFLTLEKPLMFATSAFGMGIDRHNVRQIINYNKPRSLIDFAQQFGRAGRDGLPALNTAFWSEEDSDDETLRLVRFEVPNYDFTEKYLNRLGKRIRKLTPAERRTYNLRTFTNMTRYLVERNEQIKSPVSYMRSVSVAMALLQRAGLIEEGAEGLLVHPLIPGEPKHLKLLELTQMHERMLVRERKRVATFFGAEQPTQQLMWELLRQE